MKKLNNFILTCAVLCCSMNASAGNVVLKTQKAVGEKITIATDADISVTLTWGNGATQTFDSDGMPAEFTIQDEQLTLSTSDEEKITRLYLPENGITELDLSGVATTLKKLFCPNNALTTLALSDCKALTDLDVQDNQLETISFPPNLLSMETLNCAGNKLTKLNYTFSAAMKNLIIAGNQLTGIPYLNSMSALNSVFAQNNNLTTLELSGTTLKNSKKLKNLILENNQLTALDLSSLIGLKELWVGNNELTTIDLSNMSTLVTFTAPNNQLADITWTTTQAANVYAKLANFDVSNNALNIYNFPTIDIAAHPINAILTPQSPFIFTTDDLNIDNAVSVRQYSFNGWKTTVTATIKCYNGEGEELVAGQDYTLVSRNLTFKTPQATAYIGISSTRYPGVEIFSQPFRVIDPSGISLINTDNMAKKEIYTLSGVRVDSKNLSKGIYIINGKKAIIK